MFAGNILEYAVTRDDREVPERSLTRATVAATRQRPKRTESMSTLRKICIRCVPRFVHKPNYDARNRQFGKAKLWSASHFWGERASFRASPPAQLTIRDLRESDQGVYRCRVDFRNSPTRNLKVNFTVIGKSPHPTTKATFDAFAGKFNHFG
ncbi:hypothetical protein K0M31_002182 [Melipona bicolor]|uniref:Ig-like domain-containing protein n=1 Tax=Melipona bicolor TaxID=60889 RepID=A0AA40GH37_9HYME|nr:hypothetical protein K0M31_002182 [Melipona bicolor]